VVKYIKGDFMKLLRKLVVSSLMSLGFFSAYAKAACEGVYNHQFRTLQGQSFNLCDFQDKPILVVNTASKCGFTPQFEALEKLYQDYKDQGLLVLGFPSNDFKQEHKSNKEIGDFCKLTYAVKFPMMEKSSVVGSLANPLYQQLNAKTGQSPKWNFYKYLILPQAKEVYLFGSVVQPNSAEIMDKVKPYLKR
jgi:glutathione peroxidase